MSRMMVLAVVSLMLVAGVTYAQQTAPPQQESQGQSGGQELGAAGSTQYQRLSQMARQDNASLQKIIATAEQQAKGKAIGAAFTMPEHGGAAGQPSGASAGENLESHVYVMANNQLKDVIVDAKNDKVLNIENRQMVTNPWRPRVGVGGSSGQPGLQGQGGSSGQAGAQPQPGERAGALSQIGSLTQSNAQQLAHLAEQDNLTLQKAISTAEQQVSNGKAIGVFFVLPSQVRPSVRQEAADEKANMFVKVYVVANNQLRECIIDAKNDKVVATETRQVLLSPWLGGRLGAVGTGGTTGQPGHESGQPGTSGQGERFPTGSSEGTGPGSLGG